MGCAVGLCFDNDRLEVTTCSTASVAVYACGRRGVPCVAHVCGETAASANRLWAGSWQIRWWSRALVENEADRLLECLTEPSRCLEARLLVWPLLLIITLHDNTITMARRHGQDGCQTPRPLFAASDSIATPGQYFAHLCLSAAGRCRLPPANTPNQTAILAMLHACRHLCDGCVA